MAEDVQLGKGRAGGSGTASGADLLEYGAEDATSGLKRHVGPVGLLFAGVGSIIGSGWLFGAFNATKIAGPIAIISWAVGAIMILLIGLTYAELGAMFPVSGGVVRYPHYSYGSFASFTMGWVTWVAAAVVAPIEVEGAIQYASTYAPWLMTSGKTPVLSWPQGYLLAVAGMFLFSLINLVGIRWFARLNNVVVWWKLAIILITIFAFFFTTFHAANFSSQGFAPKGGEGMVHAIVVAGIVFSFLGFRQGVELGGESDNPKRNIPLAVIGSVLITAVIYILLQIAYIAAVGPHDIAKGWSNVSFTNDAGPLAAIASVIGLGWLAKILLIDAVISPADTGLIYTTVTARLSYAMGRNDNAPRVLARTSNRGVPWASVFLAFIVGLIIFLPFPSWSKLVGFVTSATVLSFGSGSLVLMSLRQQLPEQERPFRLPGGHVIPFLAFYAANLMIYWAGWDVDWKLFATVGIGLVLLGIQLALRPGLRRVMQFAHGWWVLLWFAGLVVISWQGIYSSDDSPQGQQDNLTFGWGFLVLAVFSVLIYMLALRSRLSPEQTRAQITRTPLDEPEALAST